MMHHRQNTDWRTTVIALLIAVSATLKQQSVILISSFQLHDDVIRSKAGYECPRSSLSHILKSCSDNDLEKDETTCQQAFVTNDSSRRQLLTHSLLSVMGVVTLGFCDNNNNGQTADAISEKNDYSASLTATATSEDKVNWEDVLGKSAKRAISGGKAGASAAVVQVLLLMWLRTTMNYQYRYGGTFQEALSKLYYEEGGIPRLYQGLPFALLQGPLTRFGDTAANVGMLALLSSSNYDIPIIAKTAAGSIAAGVWRIVLMPIDTSKTVMQVEGAQGLQKLKTLVLDQQSLSPLYQGAIASAAATAVGHFPWFLTFNFLNSAVPPIDASEELLQSLLRSAIIGICASCVSDTCSNSLRVIKTTKQTAALSSTPGAGEGSTKKNVISYGEAVALVLEKDGWAGLLGRGLRTRLLTNALQGAMFSILWKYFETIMGSSS